MNEVAVHLSCNHWTRVRVDKKPSTGQLVICTTCHTESLALAVNTHEWRVRCYFPGCTYGRWCGQDRDDALNRQTRHKNAYPSHDPTVAYDRVTYDGLGTILTPLYSHDAGKRRTKRQINGPARHDAADGAIIEVLGNDTLPPF